MPKKTFKNNPALAFIGTQQAAQYDAQEDTQEAEREETQEAAQDITQHSGHEYTQDNAQYHTQEVTHEVSRAGYVKTQGRKGHKKPRINLAFDSDTFLDAVRIQAEREGKSITQLVNEAVSLYLEKRSGKK